MRKLLFSISLCAAILFSYSFKKEIIDNVENEKNTKSNVEKEKEFLFKASRGSNRVTIFEQLKTKIKTKQQAIKEATTASTDADITAILGTPDIAIMKHQLIYTLNPANGCKVLFIIDAKGLLESYSVKDCN